MEIVYIPVSILNKMALWLANQQNDEGAFVETSEYYYDRSFWVTTSDRANFLPFLCFEAVGYVIREGIWLVRDHASTILKGSLLETCG